jgi:hypothetical protein
MSTITVAETRRITFRMTDFAAALAIPEIARMVELTGRPPYLAMGDCERNIVGVRSVLIGDGSAAFVIDGSTLCALLIKLCANLKIPIPKRASKHVECAPTELSLVLKFTAESRFRSSAIRTVKEVQW